MIGLSVSKARELYDVSCKLVQASQDYFNAIDSAQLPEAAWRDSQSIFWNAVRVSKIREDDLRKAEQHAILENIQP